MKYGDFIFKDALGQDIKVGTVVLEFNWYSGSYDLYPTIAIGSIKHSGNLRTMVLGQVFSNNVDSNWVGWLPHGKGIAMPKDSVLPTLKHHSRLPRMLEYLDCSDPQELFDRALDVFTHKNLSTYQLEKS